MRNAAVTSVLTVRLYERRGLPPLIQVNGFWNFLAERMGGGRLICIKATAPRSRIIAVEMDAHDDEAQSHDRNGVGRGQSFCRPWGFRQKGIET